MLVALLAAAPMALQLLMLAALAFMAAAAAVLWGYLRGPRALVACLLLVVTEEQPALRLA
jgi:hypothetical protein